MYVFVCACVRKCVHMIPYVFLGESYKENIFEISLYYMSSLRFTSKIFQCDFLDFGCKIIKV